MSIGGAIGGAIGRACDRAWEETVSSHALVMMGRGEDTTDAIAFLTRFMREVESSVQDLTGCRGQARMIVSHILTTQAFRHLPPRLWQHPPKDFDAASLASFVTATEARVSRDSAQAIVVLLEDRVPERAFPAGVTPERAAKDPAVMAEFRHQARETTQFTHMFVLVASIDATTHQLHWRVFMAFTEWYTLPGFLGLKDDAKVCLEHMTKGLRPMFHDAAQALIRDSPFSQGVALTPPKMTAFLGYLQDLDTPTVTDKWLQAYKMAFCVDMEPITGEPTGWTPGCKLWSADRITIPLETLTTAEAESAAIIAHITPLPQKMPKN